MRVFLIRHAQTAWNAEGKAQGHTDIELDQEGREQAELLGRTYRGVFSKVLTSDLSRSVQTASALDAPETWKDHRLRERSFGEWEGLQFDDIHRRIQASGQTNFDFRPPGGESFHDVWNRLEPVAKEIFDHEDDLVIVTHGGACAILLAQLIKGTAPTTRAFRFANTGLTELEMRADRLFVMVRYNDTSHLRLPARQGDLDGSIR